MSTRHRCGRFLALAFLLAGLLVPPVVPARAGEVSVEHLGLELLGNLQTPSERALAGAPVALILHGTLAHHDMEIVKTLQANLLKQGLASLAVTLSLGLDKRRGMGRCDLEHDHRATDASGELAAWLAWLKSKGVARVVLVGHSLGAQQVAAYAAGGPDPLLDRLVLIAPPTQTPAEAAARYKSTTGGDLAALIAKARAMTEADAGDSLMDVPGFLHCRPARVTADSFLDYADPEAKRSVLRLLADIAQPVLVIAGSADTVTRDVAPRLKAAGLPKVGSIVTIDGADHFFRDLFADDLAERIAPFAAAVGPPGR